MYNWLIIKLKSKSYRAENMVGGYGHHSKLNLINYQNALKKFFKKISHNGYENENQNKTKSYEL